MSTQSDNNNLVEDIMPESSINDETSITVDNATDENTRIPLAAHHRKHHHHPHTSHSNEKAVEIQEEADRYEENEEPTLSETQEKKRIPLAAHHRKHHHRHHHSSEHRHHHSRHRRNRPIRNIVYQTRHTYDDLQRYESRDQVMEESTRENNDM